MTRDYARELETTLTGLPTFTEDSSLLMLDDTNMELLENHVESAVQDYVEWWGENQSLFNSLMGQYD